MKEINIAKVLVKMRKQKGVTQDELANFIGVSKASVSKWETEQSYPDVTFLPQLASYFNISVDELIDYQPQMTKEDIHKLYKRLCADFAAQPFDQVLEECREIVKKYYSCFPLLLQIGVLMVNHVELLKDDPQQVVAIIEEAKALLVRVKEESGDLSLIKKALFMEAYCCLAVGDANGVLELLDGTVEAALPPETLMSPAYQMMGRVDEAKAILQVGIYQNLVVLFNYFPALLLASTDDPAKYEEILRRALTVAEAFDMKHLHPGVLVGTYIAAAQGYIVQQNNQRALDMLQQYTNIVTGDIYPLTLHGDEFFDRLDCWLDKLELGNDLPRDDKTIKKSMANVIVSNPNFAGLAGEQRFQSICEKLQSNC